MKKKNYIYEVFATTSDTLGFCYLKIQNDTKVSYECFGNICVLNMLLSVNIHVHLAKQCNCNILEWESSVKLFITKQYIHKKVVRTK